MVSLQQLLAGKSLKRRRLETDTGFRSNTKAILKVRLNEHIKVKKEHMPRVQGKETAKQEILRDFTHRHKQGLSDKPGGRLPQKRGFLKRRKPKMEENTG